MSSFAQYFVFSSVVVGTLTLAAGVALGVVWFPFAVAATFCFGIAGCVLWDYAREA